jgi:hypothetical protein
MAVAREGLQNEDAMQIQVINFRLKELSPEGYASLCDELAPTFAIMPGLLAKVWLTDDASGTYGGVYTWRDREAMTAANVFSIVQGHPNFADATSRDYGILEGPTRVTHGLVGATV